MVRVCFVGLSTLRSRLVALVAHTVYDGAGRLPRQGGESVFCWSKHFT